MTLREREVEDLKGIYAPIAANFPHANFPDIWSCSACSTKQNAAHICLPVMCVPISCSRAETGNHLILGIITGLLHGFPPAKENAAVGKS